MHTEKHGSTSHVYNRMVITPLDPSILKIHPRIAPMMRMFFRAIQPRGASRYATRLTLCDAGCCPEAGRDVVRHGTPWPQDSNSHRSKSA
jgi:hypothetical protein